MSLYIQEANQQFVSMHNRYPIVLDHGESIYLHDTERKKYLDPGSGSPNHLINFVLQNASVALLPFLYIPHKQSPARTALADQPKHKCWSNAHTAW